MGAYGQFCPVAKAMELLDERWTMLVIRELLEGSRTFNALRRGVPRMSPALLSDRLRRLARAGVIERYEDGSRVSYAVTPAGRELRSVIEAIGRWGIRWIPELGDEDLDPHLLMWDIHRNIDLDHTPDKRVVVHFHLSGSSDKKSRFWLVLDPGSADLCLTDPGHDVDVMVKAHIRTMVDYWMGHVRFSQAMKAGDLEVTGPSRLVRQLPAWFKRSEFATVPLPVG